MNYSFKGNGDTEFNDVGLPDSLFDLAINSYSFLIRPKSEFWRFGLRFSDTIDRRFSSSDSRYGDKELKHLEIAVGEMESKTRAWNGSNRLYLQEYHLINLSAGSVINKWDNYIPKSEIFVEVKWINQDNILVSLSSTQIPTYSTILALGSSKFFKLFAWADNIDFDIECEVEESITINLNQIKALTGQSIEIKVKDLMIFFGRNNCGKTSIILGASHHFMNSGNFVMDYIGANRFEMSDTIDPKQKGKVDLQVEGRKNRNTYSQSTENLGINAVHEFWIQDEETRFKIAKWLAENFEELKITKKEIDEFSSIPEVTIDGRNPRFQGTGARMALGIIVQLFCPQVKFLSIDEPELSLEPRAQKKLFELVKQAASGIDGVPKKKILIATHSHIFIDKENPENNYKVTKVNGKVKIEQIQEESELQNAVYDLLGSNPSDLFFPANIVVVEGRSDHVFLVGVLDLLKKHRFVSNKKIVFHFVSGIERAKSGLLAVEEMLKTQSYMPIYHDKICGLLDAPNNNAAEKIITEIIDYFKDDGSRFLILKKEAIEYYYPLTIISEIVGREIDQSEFNQETKLFLDRVNADKNNHQGKYFDLFINKVDLARKVVDHVCKKDDPNLIDNDIKKLIITADELAF
ncbi:MAG: AAA family ATPase [Chryseolinea sp.]